MTVHVLGPAAVAAPEGRSPPPMARELRAIVLRGLRDRRRSVLAWGLSLGSLDAFMAAIYPTIRSSIEQVARSYPAGLKEAFGVQAMNSVEGYIHAEMFSLIIPLAIGFYAIRAVAAPLVGAEESGDLDTTLSLPISRRALAAAACAVAALTSAAILATVALMTFLAGVLAGTHISLGLVIAGCAGVWPLALFAGGLSALLAGTRHGLTLVSGAAMGVLVAMYALDLAGRLASSLDPLRLVSAFRYYGSPMLDGIDPAAFAGLSGAGIALMIAGAVLLERRDILH